MEDSKLEGYRMPGVLIHNWFEDWLQSELAKKESREPPKFEGESEHRAQFGWPEPIKSDDPYADTSKGCLAVPPPIKYADRAPGPSPHVAAGLPLKHDNEKNFNMLHWPQSTVRSNDRCSIYSSSFLAPRLTLKKRF